jgi:tetratricopeptide (TPR) repeat protein
MLATFLSGSVYAQDKSLADAHKLREAGKVEEALTAYRAIAQSEKCHPYDRGGAKLWVAHISREQGKRDEALTAYRDVVAMIDAHPHDQGGAQLWVAHSCREAGRTGEAREAYAKVAGILGAHPHDRGGALVWLAALQIDAKEQVVARDLLTSVLALQDLHQSDVARAKGLSQKLSQRAQPDKEASEQALQSGHKNAGKGESEAAMNSFLRALELAGTPTQAVRARNQVAFVWKGQKRAEEARVFLRISLEAEGADDPAKAEAQYLLAHSWIDQGNWKEAYLAWEKLLEMTNVWDAAKSEAYMIVGNGRLEAKKYAEARTFFQKCLDLKGENWQRWESQAGIVRSYREENNTPAAITALEILLRMDGLDDERRQRAEEQLKELRNRK